MKRVLYLILLIAFTSCGNSSSPEQSGTDTSIVDTAYSGRVITDTTGASSMNIDTTGMSNAR